MAQNKPAGRGRPRLFVPDVALARATEVFWDCGFAAPSLDDLGEAMGMNRPSIRAAFGDKSDLFLKALGLYEAQGREALQLALDPELPLRAALRGLFSDLADRYAAGNSASRGCLLFSVAQAEAVASPAVREVVAGAMDALDAAFEARFAAARVKGEIADAASPADLALLASSLIHSLSIRARAGEPPDVLARVIEVFLEMICGPEVIAA